jgi:hypothetical protein
MVQDGIRADPASRLPGRAPGRARPFGGVLHDARRAWVQTASLLGRLKLLVLGAVLIWGGLRMACLTILLPRDPGPFYGTPAGLACLYALAILLNTGPVLLAAVLMPSMHRMIIGAPAPEHLATLKARTKLTGVLFVLVLAGLAVLNLYVLLPRLLIVRLGQTSALLTMILLLPEAILALLALLRLSLGLPAISLGLPRALAEGWDISRGHTLRVASVFAVTLLPPLLVMALWLWWRPRPLGWPALFLRPCIDLAFVSLTASLTGLFYRKSRLPLAFRPDRRPSRNPAHRQQPILP